MRLTCSIVERHDAVDVALHDPLEAVADADDLDAFEPAADRRRADHAVDAGAGPPPTSMASRFVTGTMVTQPFL